MLSIAVDSVTGLPRLPENYAGCLVVQVKGVLPAIEPEQQSELLACAAPFQNAYLGAALTRMSDAVTAAFPGTSRTLTSSAELQKCIA